MKYEYLKVEGACRVEQMNSLGLEGWELVFQRPDNFHSLVTYFKREKVESVKAPEPVKVAEPVKPPEPVKVEPKPVSPVEKPAPKKPEPVYFKPKKHKR